MRVTLLDPAIAGQVGAYRERAATLDAECAE